MCTRRNKKGVRPMGELIGAILITVVLTIVAVSVLFALSGKMISPEENAKNSGRNLAKGIDTIMAPNDPLQCNEVKIALFPDYRLVVNRTGRKVLVQHKEDDSYPTLERPGFSLNILWNDAVCSPYSQDPSDHTTHCGIKESRIDFLGGQRFNGDDYLVINKNGDDKIIGTYCVCAITNIITGTGAVYIYPKGWSPTCVGFAEDVVGSVGDTVGSRLKSSAVEAYERVKNWLRKLVL